MNASFLSNVKRGTQPGTNHSPILTFLQLHCLHLQPFNFSTFSCGKHYFLVILFFFNINICLNLWCIQGVLYLLASLSIMLVVHMLGVNLVRRSRPLLFSFPNPRLLKGKHQLCDLVHQRLFEAIR